MSTSSTESKSTQSTLSELAANAALVQLDQQYRTVPQLKINYIWPEHYNTASTPSSLRFGDMVVAQQRIGCTVPK